MEDKLLLVFIFCAIIFVICFAGFIASTIYPLNLKCTCERSQYEEKR